MQGKLYKITVLVVIIAILGVGIAIYGSLNKKRGEIKSIQMAVETHGPGESPHAHFPDPEKTLKIKEIARSPDDLPPSLSRKENQLVEINLRAEEVIAAIAPEADYFYFTYNGKVPGPLLRVKEGDLVKISLENPKTNSHIHSIDLHAATGPGGGGKIQVAPGEKKDFTFKALAPGLFIYHSASGNVGSSTSNGMYGLILVEPKNGLPKVDKEFYVTQGEFFTEGGIGEKGFQLFSPEKYLREEPTYVVFNGRVNGLVDYPLKAEVGEKIRIYFGNAGVTNISSFHIIGEIFDKVYQEASLLSSPLLGVQTTLAPAGGATAVELKLDYPTDYILVDHSLVRLEKGAFGVLRVEGNKNTEIFSTPWLK